MKPSPTLFTRLHKFIPLSFIFISVGVLVASGCRTHQSPPLHQYRLSALIDLNDEKMNDISYQKDIQPLFDARCASCHSCFDAPAQLKLTSAEGLLRGASKQQVYDLSRLSQADPTRLGEDANTVEGWREKGFFTVLADPLVDTPQARLDTSVMYQMLAMSRLRQLPEGGILDAIVRDSHDVPVAPTIEEFPDYIQKFPHAGMPFYTYGLTEEEFTTLSLWIASGAEVEETDLSFSPAEQAEVSKWETLFNGDSLKDQLAARYLFEHLFSAHIYFESLPESGFFKVIRSKTPPGQPIEAIYTRRPNDDPGVDRVYYRMVKYGAEIMRKNHLPFEFSDARYNEFMTLFWDTDWEPETLPGYSLHLSQRPFDVYQDIPERSRYQFMLNSNFYFVQSFIRGPVCRGQIALNGIWDHFFVYFFAPDADPSVTNPEFMVEAKPNLVLPLGITSENDTTKYRKVMKRVHAYEELQDQTLIDFAEAQGGIGLQDIWDGDDEEDTPYLTVFRHFDTASVVPGFIGETPPHGWFVDYNLIERIYYLLVANYDVFGSVSHQLSTRLYFDYLRYEGEVNYLRLFPQADRQKLFNQWYDGVPSMVMKVHYPDTNFNSLSAIDYDDQSDVMNQLRNMVSQTQVSTYGSATLQRDQGRYLDFSQETAPFVQHFPEVTFLRIRKNNGDNEVYTIIRNKAFKNVTDLLDEAKRREPRKDNLLVVPGLVGDYPNMMMNLSQDEYEIFMKEIFEVRGIDEVGALWLKYGTLRTSKDFWPTLDWFTAWQLEQDPIQAGRFDLKHYYLTQLLSLPTADLVKAPSKK
ncbi:fatty acid cis/trans isomerase [Kiritimatiellota bacterium B12222]|nr:fatty acid cis/trans isomerase [Kiritimatiellota bacterium B12222]